MLLKFSLMSTLIYRSTIPTSYFFARKIVSWNILEEPSFYLDRDQLAVRNLCSDKKVFHMFKTRGSRNKIKISRTIFKPNNTDISWSFGKFLGLTNVLTDIFCTLTDVLNFLGNLEVQHSTDEKIVS